MPLRPKDIKLAALDLPSALRYFFSPFVIAFYYCLYDPSSAKLLVKEFGVIPAVAFLVGVITIYFFYRHAIYNVIIMPLNDLLRTKNQRIFIKRRYLLGCNPITSTIRANQILHELSNDPVYLAALKKRERPMRAGGVHLLHQAFLCALVFAGLSVWRNDANLVKIFAVIAAAQLFTAIRMDIDYDDEEMILVKSMLTKLDKAARSLGFKKRSARRTT